MDNQRNHVRFAVLTLLIVFFDQLSKHIILTSLAFGERFSIMANVAIVHVRNTGFAFSLLSDYPIIPIIATLLVFVGLWYYYSTFSGTPYALPLALVLGGAVGNLLDRIRYGAVIDFVSIGSFPAFNVADSALTVAAFWLLYLINKEK